MNHPHFVHSGAWRAEQLRAEAEHARLVRSLRAHGGPGPLAWVLARLRGRPVLAGKASTGKALPR